MCHPGAGDFVWDQVAVVFTEMCIQQALYDKMLAYVIECLPEEACGLLGGKNSKVICTLPMTNLLHSPVAYRLDPQEQLEAFLLLEEQSLDLVGIFHSHPNGPAVPSERDLAEWMYPESACLIWSRQLGKWLLRAFMIDGKKVDEFPITIFKEA